MKLQEILEQAVRDEDVSDVFLVAGLPVTMKRNGVQTRMDMAPLMPIPRQCVPAERVSGGCHPCDSF